MVFILKHPTIFFFQSVCHGFSSCTTYTFCTVGISQNPVAYLGSKGRERDKILEMSVLMGYRSVVREDYFYSQLTSLTKHKVHSFQEFVVDI